METERIETRVDEVIRRFGAKRILQMLDALEKGGYVALTESGVNFRTRAGEMLEEPFGAHLGTDAQIVAERLRNWRRDAARRRNISAFLVMTNKVLFALAAARPHTPEGLRELGVSAKVLESEGASILAALACGARSENPQPVPLGMETVAENSPSVPLDAETAGENLPVVSLGIETVGENVPRVPAGEGL